MFRKIDILLFGLIILLICPFISSANTTSVSMSQGDSLQIEKIKNELRSEMRLQIKADSMARAEEMLRLRSEMYDKAFKAIEGKQSTINIMVPILAILLTLLIFFNGLQMLRLQNTVRKIDEEIRKAEDNTDKMVRECRGAIDKEISEIRERRLEIDKLYDTIILKEKEMTAKIDRVANDAEKTAAEAKKLAEEQKITYLDEKVKLINEADAAKSVEEYEKLLSQMELAGMPKDRIPSSLHYNVAENYLALGKFDKAIEEYELYVEREPADEDGYYSWGWALTELFKKKKDVSLLKKAIEKYKKAAEINDKDDWTHFNMACAFALMGNRNEMLNALRKAIGLNVDWKEKARKDTDFEKYWDDPDFIALTKE